MVSHTFEVAKKLNPHPMVVHDSMDPAMCMQGEVILRIFNEFLKVLASKDLKRASSREGPLEGHEDAVLPIASPKRARIVLNRTLAESGSDAAHFFVIHHDMSKFRGLRQARNDALQDKRR